MQHTEFLKICQLSSQDAYQAFKNLLSELENPATRKTALLFCHDFFAWISEKYPPTETLENYYFSVVNLALHQEGGKKTHLQLLQLPSTFAPEEWSFTFFEGLARYKPSEFHDRIITELGCGIGWISLALAKQTRPAKIYGLDINPKAILCSRLNLYLNAFDREGRPSWEHEGKNLTDIVEFHVSDLLEYCRAQKIFVDRVIGCIPQVLNPDPEFTSNVLSRPGLEQANDEFLYSLSNYTSNQGYVEDQFGLGLIARAVEESVDVLKTSGKVVLNLGGRPGSSLLNQLFLRRGFTVRSLWQTQVTQAKDTDIHSLVSIEEKTNHRFEFFVGQNSHTPVSAKTALAYAEGGGEIAHSLTVYEAQLRDSVHVPKVLQFMRQKGYEEARNSLDLSYSEDSLALEKMSFLHALTEHLENHRYFSYEETKGIQSFRGRLAAFFKNYFKIPLEADHFLITPSRASICRNILRCYRPKKVLVDSQLASEMGYSPGTFEVPRSSDLLCEMMEKLHPEVVIYSMTQSEAETRESFLKICEVSEKTGSRIFIDISDLIELSSIPKSNGIFRYLAKEPLPLHVSLIGGLVKNRLYRDLEVCFLISGNLSLLTHLEYAGELTYSRTPLLSQLYYDRILQELINFQIIETADYFENTNNLPMEEPEDSPARFISLAKTAQVAFSHPAILAEGFARDPNFIRLDYGENCLSTPTQLQSALFESFAKMHIKPDECDCRSEIIGVVKSRFKIEDTGNIHVSLSDGVAPLFSELSEFCANSNSTLVFPSGSYGHFIASAQFHGAKLSIVETSSEDAFKITPSALRKTLLNVQNQAWIILSAPIVNPTGAIYSDKELESLFEVAEEHGAVVILDSIFSGLEFYWNENESIPNLSKFPRLRWAILGGISKEFVAGGLRVGYGVSTDSEVASIWKEGRHRIPHATLKFTLKKIYQKLIQADPALISELTSQKQELKHRADELSEILTQMGWKPLPPSGGLFLSATPLDSKKSPGMADFLRNQAHIVVNPPEWTGIPGYYRFVLSTPRTQFDAALARVSTSPK
jgi:methionine S-methyltransferase